MLSDYEDDDSDEDYEDKNNESDNEENNIFGQQASIKAGGGKNDPIPKSEIKEGPDGKIILGREVDVTRTIRNHRLMKLNSGAS